MFELIEDFCYLVGYCLILRRTTGRRFWCVQLLQDIMINSSLDLTAKCPPRRWWDAVRAPFE